jgi:uncharacterized membrane protein HdeD (DUF308 family)
MNTTAPTEPHPAGFSTGLGILLVLLGLLAIAAPFFVGATLSVLLGLVVLAGGIAHLVYAWAQRTAGAVLWQVAVGLLYLIAGGVLVFHPAAGVAGLTLILAIYLAVEGVVELGLYFGVKHVPGTVWFLIDGIVSLLLAILIFAQWPWSGAWALGTLVGISLIMSGVARLTLPAGRRRMALGV